MATEIEIKAWVDDPFSVKQKLDQQGIYETAFDKTDTYWVSPNEALKEVRVRKERNEGPSGERDFVLVTFKTKRIIEDMEVNDEREFEVGAAAVFEDFLARLGFTEDTIKHKRGWAWRCEGGVRAELSGVAGLGHFLELEIIADSAEEAVLKSCRERLFDRMEKAGVKNGKIETRYYTDMLKEKKAAARGGKTGTIAAVCVSEKRGTAKKPLAGRVNIVEGFGIEGDAHGGNWHRQISLLSLEQVEAFNRRGGKASEGDFGENILVSGIDLAALPVGTRLSLNGALLEISQIGKECHNHCEIYKRVGDCVMPREGIFAKVIRGGNVGKGDILEVLE